MQPANFPLDEKWFVLPTSYQEAQQNYTPGIPVESKKLSEWEGRKERVIQEKYDEIVATAAYQANPRAHLQRLIAERGENDNWQPIDGVIVRLKNELGI